MICVTVICTKGVYELRKLATSGDLTLKNQLQY